MELFFVLISQWYLGYKLRRQIANALKARSQAIKTALARYNIAASQLEPPAPTLEWEDIIQYTILSDFDLLRDTRQEVRSKPWAKPAARSLMERYFKLKRAHEEILRLNVEVRQLFNFIHDESHFLNKKIAELEDNDPELAYQVSKYRDERCRYNTLHLRHLDQLSALDGFTGNLTPIEQLPPLSDNRLDITNGTDTTSPREFTEGNTNRANRSPSAAQMTGNTKGHENSSRSLDDDSSDDESETGDLDVEEVARIASQILEALSD